MSGENFRYVSCGDIIAHGLVPRYRFKTNPDGIHHAVDILGLWLQFVLQKLFRWSIGVLDMSKHLSCRENLLYFVYVSSPDWSHNKELLKYVHIVVAFAVAFHETSYWTGWAEIAQQV